MNSVSGVKIKICGLFRACDAEYINEAMPDYAGFVFFEKSNRFVTEERAKELRQSINNSVVTVGVFVNSDPDFIKRIFEKGIISIIQLHGDEDEEYIALLRTMLPGAEIWKAFTVRQHEDLIKAEKCTADRILLDNGRGTGKRFDWAAADGFNKKIILAGGLDTDNINEAVERFNPFAVDLSSGVESAGIKDRQKIAAAVKTVRKICI